MRRSMKIVVIGLGYIGLPTAVMFASHGREVVGVDVKQEVIETLNRGELHLEEPGLLDVLTQTIASKKFKAQKEVEAADVFIVAVPTPNKNDAFKSCDTTYVIEAVNSILPYLEKGNTIIVESTIAPRTTEDVVRPLIEETNLEVGRDIYLAHCPERVLPGKILHELQYNNRIIGGVTPACSKQGSEIYKTFVKGELMETNASAAELSKLMENTYRDVNIALANELVQTTNALGIDGLEVIRLANKHPRVNIHQPGPGVGGHCLAVDPYFVIASSPETTPIIQASRKVNTMMPNYIVETIHQLMKQMEGQKMTILGLAYKGNIDDIRESPAMEIFEQLKTENRYEVVAYDPHVQAKGIETDIKRATYNSDLLVILTDHQIFKQIKNEDINQMQQRNIFDSKNMELNQLDVKHYWTLGNLPVMGEMIKESLVN